MKRQKLYNPLNIYRTFFFLQNSTHTHREKKNNQSRNKREVPQNNEGH